MLADRTTPELATFKVVICASFSRRNANNPQIKTKLTLTQQHSIPLHQILLHLTLIQSVCFENTKLRLKHCPKMFSIKLASIFLFALLGFVQPALAARTLVACAIAGIPADNFIIGSNAECQVSIVHPPQPQPGSPDAMMG